MPCPSEKSSSARETPSAAASSDNLRRDRWIAILLFIFSFACYASTLRNGFVYDDHVDIVGNPYVRNWRYLPSIFRTTTWSFLGSAGTSNYYRPLGTFLHLLVWKTFGEQAVGFHLCNVLLNALVVVALYFFGKQIFEQRAIAAIAAGLFAVHPIHSEPVNWISGVPDLEASLFVLLALLLYTRKPILDRERKLLTCGCYLAAMLAKEPAVLLAPLLVYYEHFVRGNRKETNFSTKLRQYLPALLTGAVYLVLRRKAMGSFVAVLPHADLSWREAIYSAFALVGDYARLLVWPAKLSAFHTFQASQSMWSRNVLGGIAVVLGGLLFVVLQGKRKPELAFCVVWFGVFLGPALNARWMGASVLAERYVYLPSTGFCWLVASASVFLWTASGKASGLRVLSRIVLPTAGVVVAAMGVAAIQQRNGVWRDDVILYRTTLRTDPESFVVHLNLGTAYVALEDYLRAEEELREALRLKPDNVYALNALGCVYLEQNRLEEASQAWQRAIAVQPLFPDPHFNYGRLLKKIGQDNRALAEFRSAVAMAPLNANARLYLGQELSDRGENAEADAELRESVRLSPSLPAQQELAEVLLQSGRSAEAMSVLEKAAEEFPEDSTTHLRLASLYERAERLPEAKKQYRLTLEIEPENSEARDSLARLESKPGRPRQ